MADGWEVDGEMVGSAYTLRSEDDDFTQPGILVRKVFDAKERSSPREKAEAGVFGAEYAGKAEDSVRLLAGPEMLHIVVCGDPNRNRLMTLEAGHADLTVKEIALPANWDALVRKVRETEVD